MVSSLQNLKDWLEQGIRDGATHMLVVTDTFDYVDSPVYVHPGQDIYKLISEYTGMPMSKVQEIYNLSLGWEAQGNPRKRAWNT